MRRSLGSGLLLCLAVILVGCGKTQDRTARETWDAAYLDGSKVGYYHTTVREIDSNGQKLLETKVELDLTIKRYQAVTRILMETATDETPDGKVTAVAMKQQGKLILAGAVEGERLHVKTPDGRIDRKLPWDDKVVGLSGQERFYKDHNAKPGDKFSFRTFEPTINSVVTVRAVVKDEEEVELLDGKQTLLRVEATPDKITTPQGSVALPAMTLWLDKDLLPARAETELADLGKITAYRTTKERALEKARTPTGDIGRNSLIKLKKAIPNPRAANSVVYHVTVKDDEPGTTVARDNRQSIKNLLGDSFDLYVRAVRKPPAAAPEKDPGPGEEYLAPNYYLNSDDERVRRFATEAVGAEPDPWKKAQRIERWLAGNVRHDNSAPFGRAGEVAAECRGDCRHKAMLGAAMCRAAGIPSRTAIGLVYDKDQQAGPVMAYHMWVEVWVRGEWLGIDGTQAVGSVGADHVKISDNSWHDVQSLTPLLPLQRILGKITIEVVRVNDDD
jgi:transglutaminase-like putative cysteine protease